MAGLYGVEWRKARKLFLEANPLCAMCKELGTLHPARIVDHIIPHRGNVVLFWDRENWQGLCTHHHNSTKQHHEKQGDFGFDEHGNPIHATKGW